TRGPFEALRPELERAIRAGDPTATITRAETLDADVDAQLAIPRLSSLLASAVGLAALLLAGIGLYGTMAAAVHGRFHALGVRAAIGATPARLVGMVLRHAMAIGVLGAFLGSAGGLIASRLVGSALFEVAPIDPVAWSWAAGVLVLALGAAASVPAL